MLVIEQPLSIKNDINNSSFVLVWDRSQYDWVGLVTGDFDGRNDGDSVGLSDGTSVGWMVGSSLGSLVGWLVGSSVGSSLGIIVCSIDSVKVVDWVFGCALGWGGCSTVIWVDERFCPVDKVSSGRVSSGFNASSSLGLLVGVYHVRYLFYYVLIVV